MFKISWHEGEYLSGWMVIEGAAELEALGLAHYVSLWGTFIDAGLVGEILGHCPDRSAKIELPEVQVQEVGRSVARELAARKSKEAQVEMVKCSCGHTVPRSQVMSASMGTSCPDCYDRMSDGY